MCGRARLSSDVSEIKVAFRIPPERPTPNIAPSWKVAPTDPLPVVRFDAKDHQRSLDVMRWGLVPFWAKDIKVGFSDITRPGGNFYTLLKRRCGPPLTSPLDRAAVAPSELSASELGHPRDEHLSRRSLPVFQAQLVDAPPARARRRCCRQDLGDFARDDEAATERG